MNRPLRVYSFLTHLNDDLLGFLVDIAPELYTLHGVSNVQPKLMEWKSRMAKLLHDRLTLEYGQQVAREFNMRTWVETLAKEFNDDPIFVVPECVIQQCLKNYNSSMNTIREVIQKVLFKAAV